jgi:cyclophilin family peptidyl-prolyl cis-trans isomerase
MMKLLAAACGLLLSACVHAANPQVEIKTNVGVLVVELFPEKAPKTVANFLDYVKSGHYSGTIFHRVIAGFMIQGGGFTREFVQKPTRDPIDNEAANGLKNNTGTIAMARTRRPNSATAQFFINVADNDFLNYTEPTVSGYGYTVFGRVTKGMETVNKIAQIPTGKGGPFQQDVPTQEAVIESMQLVEAK